MDNTQNNEKKFLSIQSDIVKNTIDISQQNSTNCLCNPQEQRKGKKKREREVKNKENKQETKNKMEGNSNISIITLKNRYQQSGFINMTQIQESHFKYNIIGRLK